MAKKERNFHGEADFLRHQLRALAKEMGIEIKDTNLMRKEECQARIAELNKEKYRKELEAESEIVIQEISDKDNQITNLQKEKLGLEKELAGRNNQITELTKGIKEHEKSSVEVLEEKYRKINELKKEIKELQESNQTKAKTIAANINKLAEHEKEIKEKNIELERYQKINKKLGQDIDILLAEIKELKNRKWYQFWK